MRNKHSQHSFTGMHNFVCDFENMALFFRGVAVIMHRDIFVIPPKEEE